VAHVSFIVIFGSRWTFRDVSDGWDGKLNCPDCGHPTRMVELNAVKAFTLYWFPLWTLEQGGHLLECRECFSKWEVPPELKNDASPVGTLIEPVAVET
jgi:hypothetical protein